MWPISSAVAHAIAVGAEKSWTLSILGPDLETLVPNVRFTGGEVQVDGTSIVRRTVNITVPDLGLVRANISPANPWRVYENIWAEGALYQVPVMTGWLEETDEQYLADGSVWTLPLRGREKLASESTYAVPYTARKGMRIKDFVRENLEAAGAGSDDGLYEQWDDDGATLGADHTYDEGISRLAVVDQVTRDNALDLSADPLSAWVLRRFPDVASSPIVASYRRGRDVKILGFRKRQTYATKNHFIVVAAGAIPPKRAERKDEDAWSSTSIAAIGDRVDKYSSDGITSQQQADAVCAARYATRGSVEEEIEVLVPPNPALDGLDVIEVIESRSGTVGRFLLEGFNVPLGLAAQTLRTRRVKDAAA